MEFLQEFLLTYSFKRGGIMFLSKENALRFVEECKRMKIEILGIDGFFLTDTTTQPSMENSVDFSSFYYSSKTNNLYKDAANFIGERDSDIYFEIVTGDGDIMLGNSATE